MGDLGGVDFFVGFERQTANVFGEFRKMKIAALIVLGMAMFDLTLGLLGYSDAPISMLQVHAP